MSDVARHRTVITGWGAVTPLALDAPQTWEGLLAGRSGIGTVTGFDCSDLPTSIAGEVHDFDPDVHLSHQQKRRMDRYSQYAYVAAAEALAASGLELDEESAARTGVLIGSGYGPTGALARYHQIMLDKGPRAVSPLATVAGAIDSAAGEISMAHGLTGPSRALSSACASGTDALGEAMRWIRHGVVDAVVTGGSEDILTRIDMASTGNAKALSTRTDSPQEASRPFDEDRDGFVMAAGSAVAVLESAERAVARGAPILAEIIGYASTSDAHHWTAPHPEGRGVRAAMTGALADAHLTPEEIGYINAHGTSTRLNDRSELDAIRAVFGDHTSRIPISSTKSMTGHLIGGTGALEAMVATNVIRDRAVPPTINCCQPIDPTVNFVAHEAQEHDVDTVLSNSFGFGGHNASLVLRRWAG
ncbi:3-oxoacyl-[acyl-carrier-protein] synthase II [Pseudonocardia sediminis]|uniref:3-oxoacyl-[acyl-carrier-protein] synthase 2 n=1 Tax=Pseudonocardia sediminis TaxID=1397368 RepID=A0A4Q7V270_PSEST|nr:beta-ketoacyl-ACP synthase II [Pseudonocardia sediminis]RZT88652.1 3-oxoacyl-[acyl-carrier-protein] synthase II [Pseudonocardia sediminis]